MRWRASGAALAVEGSAAAIAFDVHLQDRGVMDEAVDGRERHDLVTEPRRMPSSLIEWCLTSRSGTRTISYLVSDLP